jgi:RNA polymerase sigma-70 factor, ECF subfamily
VTPAPNHDANSACSAPTRVRHRGGPDWTPRRRPVGALARSRQDAAAFAEFYDRLAPKILRFFARRTWDGQVSLELTAETFAKAFEKRHEFRGHGDGEAAGWLWMIARNELKAYWRARQVRMNAATRLGLPRPQSSDEEILRIEELAAAEAAREALEAALAELSDDQRQVIEMRVLQELGYEEIASQLGVSGQVVRARVSRGLRQLGRSQALRSRLGLAGEDR